MKKFSRIFILVAEIYKKVEEELIPPDGGWGWLVLLASVMVNLLIPGTIKSFGVLFVEFLDVFDASPAAAAWIPSLCYFLYSSLGKKSGRFIYVVYYIDTTFRGRVLMQAFKHLSSMSDYSVENFVFFALTVLLFRVYTTTHD